MNFLLLSLDLCVIFQFLNQIWFGKELFIFFICAYSLYLIWSKLCTATIFTSRIRTSTLTPLSRGPILTSNTCSNPSFRISADRTPLYIKKGLNFRSETEETFFLSKFLTSDPSMSNSTIVWWPSPSTWWEWWRVLYKVISGKRLKNTLKRTNNSGK